MTGREKCRILREFRKQLAEANDIVYLEAECTYEGDNCLGTCPRCDAEVRYLEGEINRKAQQGGSITISGIDVDKIGIDEQEDEEGGQDVADGYMNIPDGIDEELPFS